MRLICILRGLLLAGFMLCASAAASAFAQVPKQDAHKPKVVTSFTILADMVRNVAGDAVIVESITRPGVEIHTYQPTPQDLVRVQDADLVLYNGLNLEQWFTRFLQDVKKAKMAVLSDGVNPLPIRKGPYAGKPNPHAWMSTTNAEIYIENIRKALTALDPANAALYARNATAYRERLRALHQETTQALATLPAEQRVLVTSEGAFSYLARDLGFDEAYLWPINAEQQGTPQQVRAVIDEVRARRLPVVFSESTVSPKPAQQVAAETGARYGGVLYVDSLSPSDGPVPTYLDLLRVTTRTIAEGFHATP